jgi:hypothetical protein
VFEGVTPESIAVLAVVALFWTLITTVVVWKWVIPLFFGPYVRQTITDMLSEPDEDTKKAIASLVTMIFATNIKTGRRVTDEDGKEGDEVQPLLKFLGREMTNMLLAKLKQSRGGMVASVGSKLEGALEGDPSLASLMGPLGPRKGQTTYEFLLEQAAARIMPMVDKKITEKLNGAVDNTWK